MPSPPAAYVKIPDMTLGMSSVDTIMTLADPVSSRFDADRMEAALTMTQMSQGHRRKYVEVGCRKQRRQNLRRGHDLASRRERRNRPLREDNLAGEQPLSSDVVGGTDLCPSAARIVPCEHLSTTRDGRTVDDATLARMTHAALQRPVGKFYRTCCPHDITPQNHQNHIRTSNVKPSSGCFAAGRSHAAVGVSERPTGKRRSSSEYGEFELRFSRSSSTTRRASFDEVAATRSGRSPVDEKGLRRQNSDPSDRRRPPTRIRPVHSAAIPTVPASRRRIGSAESPSTSACNVHQSDRADGGGFIPPVGGQAAYFSLVPLSAVSVGVYGPTFQLSVPRVVALHEQAGDSSPPPSSTDATTRHHRLSSADGAVNVAQTSTLVYTDKIWTSSYARDACGSPKLVLLSNAVSTSLSASDGQLPVCVADQAVSDVLEPVKAEDRFPGESNMDTTEPLDLTRNSPNLAAAAKSAENRLARSSKYDQLSRSSSYGSLSALKAFYQDPSMKSGLRKTQSDSSEPPGIDAGVMASVNGMSPVFCKPTTVQGSANGTAAANWQGVAAQDRWNAEVDGSRSRFRLRPSQKTTSSLLTRVYSDSPERTSEEATVAGSADLGRSCNRGHVNAGAAPFLTEFHRKHDINSADCVFDFCQSDAGSVPSPMKMEKPIDGEQPAGEGGGSGNMVTFGVGDSPPIVKLSINDNSAEDIEEEAELKARSRITGDTALTMNAVRDDRTVFNGLCTPPPRPLTGSSFSKDVRDLSWRLPLKKRRILDSVAVATSVNTINSQHLNSAEDRLTSSCEKQQVDPALSECFTLR